MAGFTYYTYPWEVGSGEVTVKTDGLTFQPNSVLVLEKGWRLQSNHHQERLRLKEGTYLLSMPKYKSQRVLELHHDARGKQTLKVSTPRVLLSLNAHQSYRDTDLYKQVVAWSAFFDDCLYRQDQRHDRLTWGQVAEVIRELEAHPDEPQMSLIVRISREMSGTLQNFALGIRRILSRHRKMMPVDKMEELDAACLDWYIRQPGISPAQKAAFNQQRLKAVARQEFVDTLENRVLKDFLKRCVLECEVYQRNCSLRQRQSDRARKVRSFGKVCQMILKTPIFSGISNLTGVVQPNYVLQGDSRYRKMWLHYKQLVRKQRTYDDLWSAQAFLWGDVVSVMLGVAIRRMQDNTGVSSLFYSEVAKAYPLIADEHRGGQRLDRRSLLSPIFIEKTPGQGVILEIISSVDIKNYCQRTQLDLTHIDSLANATILSLESLDDAKPPVWIVVWPWHQLHEPLTPEALKDMQKSLEKTVEAWSQDPIQVHLVVLVSEDTPKQTISLPRIHIVRLGSAIYDWSKDADEVELVLMTLLETYA